MVWHGTVRYKSIWLGRKLEEVIKKLQLSFVFLFLKGELLHYCCFQAHVFDLRVQPRKHCDVPSRCSTRFYLASPIFRAQKTNYEFVIGKTRGKLALNVSKS